MKYQTKLVYLMIAALSFYFSCGKKKPTKPEVTIVSDIDGNGYKTVTIGSQIWMAENLKVTHYRNGDPIPNVTDSLDWANLTTGAYCSYNNDDDNVASYGRLYNWYAVNDSRNIAPEGWHVPSDDEWKQLEMYLGMSQLQTDSIALRGTDEGDKMKATGSVMGGDGLWYGPNIGATNEYGFSALPGGHRYCNPDYIQPDFLGMGDIAIFWSSTELDSNLTWYRSLYSGDSGVRRYYSYMQSGFSVRCLRD